MEVQKTKFLKYYINKLYHFGNITTFYVERGNAKIKHYLNNISTGKFIYLSYLSYYFD